MKDTIEAIIAKSAAVIQKNEGDYIGENGLLYCGKCGTAKQTEVEIFGEIKRPMCLCKCAKERKDAEEAEERRKEFERRIKELRRAGFPESAMEEWTFENDDGDNEKVMNAMRRYVENFGELRQAGKGLLLYGEVGTGKTYAACEVANALIDKGYPVLVTNFARLTNLIQAKFEGRQEYIDSLSNFALIVIDDLGAERNSEFMKEMIFNIVDARYRAGLPMLVTTNLTIEEIKKPGDTASSRIYDRVIERCFPIEVAGNSRRRKAVRKEYDEMKKILGL